MHTRFQLLLGAALVQQAIAQQSPLTIPSPPTDVNPVPNDLQAFSIEFSYFPDYAGNRTHPNTYSRNLLENFRRITGIPPLVRVGGTTQEKSTYYPNQTESIKLRFKNEDDDQPQEVEYGPAFFESYDILKNARFIHGLNFVQNDSLAQLETAAAAACKRIGVNLDQLELGNEPNVGSVFAGLPSNYDIDDYIVDWNWKSHVVASAVKKVCPGYDFNMMAPSFIIISDNVWKLTPGLKELLPSGWNLDTLFDGGYDTSLVKDISVHSYMGFNLPSPSMPSKKDQMQNNYLNHSFIVENLRPHIERSSQFSYLGIPYTFGETSSMALQGQEGLSDTFAMALWLVDYSLWAGAHNILRLHFHQGRDYRYSSWQPITTNAMPAATRPPYYGQIMVASALGDAKDIHIVPIPLQTSTESAYGIYSGNQLTKIVVLNMRAFYSGGGDRPEHFYRFNVPDSVSQVQVERLMAAGCEVTDKITFGGVSYDYSNQGKPKVVQENEVRDVEDGVVGVHIPDSSGVLLTLL